MVKELVIPGCRKKYLIYDDGQVFDIERNKFRKPVEHRKGYYKMSFRIYGKVKCLFVHRLVLMTFNPVEGMENLQVNHIDGNKKNNCLENLEWCTLQENIDHAVKNGLFKNCTGYGSQSHNHKLNEKSVAEIKRDLFCNHISIRKVAEKYGVSFATIFQIKKGNNWKQVQY